MNRITFAKPVNIISGSILALSVVLTFSAFSAKRDAARAGLFTTGVTLAVVALGNKIYGSCLEQIADRKNSEVLSSVETENRRLKDRVLQLEESDDFLQKLSSNLQTQVKNLEDENQARTLTNDELNRNLTQVTAQYQSVIADLQVKHGSEIADLKFHYKALLADSDGSFNSVCQSILQLIIDALKLKIDSEYEDMFDKANRVIDKGLFDDTTREKLEEFKQKIDEDEQEHLTLVEQLELAKNHRVQGKEDFLERVNNALTVQKEIFSEIFSRQIQYRAILKENETRKIRAYRKHLPDLCKKEDAMRLLAEQGQASDAELVKIQEWQRALEETVQDLRLEHENLIAEHEKILQENKDLKRPLFWVPAPREDLRMANNIMAYFEKYRIILDRGHSEYDVWQATVSFYPARNTVAPLVSDLNKHSEVLQHRIVRSYNEPKFEFDPESGLYTCYLQLKRKPEKQALTPAEKAKSFIQPKESLIEFVDANPHIGFWGQTGSGKTTAIGNLLGAMHKLLGEDVVFRVTLPKIDESTQAYFDPDMVDYMEQEDCIFGFLEAALEAQYRMHGNIQRFKSREKIEECKPMIFFFDEINLIADRFNRVNEPDLEDILYRFKQTISGDRLAYFESKMENYLRNYKNEFFKQLLLFIWRAGRSLNIKTLIAGQTLQPSKFKATKADLHNCAYLALGKSLKTCNEYKTPSHQQEQISSQIDEVKKLKESDSSFIFVGLFCPVDSNSYFSYLPEPNYYEIHQKKSLQTNRIEFEVKSNFLVDETLAGSGLQSNVVSDLEKNYGTTTGVGFPSENVVGSQQPEVSQGKRWRQSVGKIEKLPLHYKNLGYGGCREFFYKLPTKSNGKVNRKLAYKEIFKVTRWEKQKIYSEFIDLLEAEFGE